MNNVHDLLVKFLVLLLPYVKLEIEHANVSIGHLAHLIPSAVDRDSEEYGLFLVPIKIELGGKCHGCMPYTFGVEFSYSRSLTTA